MMKLSLSFIKAVVACRSDNPQLTETLLEELKTRRECYVEAMVYADQEQVRLRCSGIIQEYDRLIDIFTNFEMRLKDHLAEEERQRIIKEGGALG